MLVVGWCGLLLLLSCLSFARQCCLAGESVFERFEKKFVRQFRSYSRRSPLVIFEVREGSFKPVVPTNCP